MLSDKVNIYINKIIKHTRHGNDYKIILYQHKLDKLDKLNTIQHGNGTPQYSGKKSSIMVKVPSSIKNYMNNEAKKLKDNGFRGGTNTGELRMRQLATKSSISIKDVMYIRNFFARHIVTSYPSYLKWKRSGKPYNDQHWKNKRGIYAIAIWGGEPALKWVNSSKIINLLNKHLNKTYNNFLKKS
jgi:hypothetical protein